jgi:hypothetical protein
MNSIGYFYNLHVNFDAFLYSVMSVKMFSPGSPIITFMDRSLESPSSESLDLKYGSVLFKIGIPIKHRDVWCSYIDQKDGSEINTPKMKEYFSRIYEACKILNTDWIIRMEDDVHLRHPIKHLPETTCAGNYELYGMGGGSIFKRDRFIEIYENLPEDWFEKKIKNDGTYSWAADGLMKQLFTDHGETYSKWVEIIEDWQGDNPEAAVHHGNKTLYDKKYLEFRGL